MTTPKYDHDTIAKISRFADPYEKDHGILPQHLSWHGSQDSGPTGQKQWVQVWLCLFHVTLLYFLNKSGKQQSNVGSIAIDIKQPFIKYPKNGKG